MWGGCEEQVWRVPGAQGARGSGLMGPKELPWGSKQEQEGLGLPAQMLGAGGLWVWPAEMWAGPAEVWAESLGDW